MSSTRKWKSPLRYSSVAYHQTNSIMGIVVMSGRNEKTSHFDRSWANQNSNVQDQRRRYFCSKLWVLRECASVPRQLWMENLNLSQTAYIKWDNEREKKKGIEKKTAHCSRASIYLSLHSLAASLSSCSLYFLGLGLSKTSLISSKVNPFVSTRKMYINTTPKASQNKKIR